MERKRYYEISRGCIIEIDAALDTANELNYILAYDTKNLAKAMIRTFKILSGLIASKVSN